MDVFKIYQKLLAIYGPQGWWPIYIPKKAISSRTGQTQLARETGLTYGINYTRLGRYRTEFRDPYFEIAIGAILTQSAAWTNVAKTIITLFKAKALTPRRILSLGDSDLEGLIRPVGYYKQKAKKVKIFSRWLVENYKGNIVNLKVFKVTTIRRELLMVWGIGKETADSIILYSLNKPIFVVDEYFRRLCKKFGIVLKDYDHYQAFSQPITKQTAELYQEIHALIVASGKDKHRKINSVLDVDKYEN